MTFVIQNKTATAVVIIAATMVLMTGFQMKQIMAERTFINESFAQQEGQLKQVGEVNKQFESLALGTSKLAGEGNDNARAIMAELRKIGVTVNPNATPGQKALEFKQPEQQQAPAAPTEGKTTPTTPAAPAAAPKVGN